MDVFRLLVTLALFIGVLGAIVLVHEVGHYLTAKWLNVRVLEFGVGFPPRARVLRASGETLWTLNWLPLGGFVKLDGEDGDVSDPRSFAAKPLWGRLAILLAGVVMNVVLAFLLFLVVAWLATPIAGVRIPQDGVQPDSPAARAGLVPGDAIVGLNGQRYDIYGPNILTAIRGHIGETVSLDIQHADGTIDDVPVTLRKASEIDAEHGPLGISATPEHPFTTVFLDQHASRPLGDAVGIAWAELPRWGSLILGGLADLVSGFVADPTAPPPAAGPIGIAVQIGEVFFSAGWAGLLLLAGVLSINLAVVNILPFPPLDGGRMLVLVLKRALGKRLSLRAEQLTYFVGAVFLFAFIIWITGFDILRQLGATP